MSETNPAAVPQPEEPKKQLTVNDPVDQATLQQFSELQTARLQIAERILDLEQEKIKALRAAANIDNERQRLFEGILISRGLSPATAVEIDAKTGLLAQVNPNGAPAAAAPQGQVVAPS